MKKNRLSTLILFAILLLLILFALIFNLIKSNELKKNGIILTAKIVDIVSITKGSPLYRYQFRYNGKDIYRENSTGVKKKFFFIGKNFPVLFSPKTENSELLIAPEDFEKFRLPFPDSLQWVIPYKNNK